MSKLKDNLEIIGFNFEGLDQTEIDRRNSIHRKINYIKSKQSGIHTKVKLFKPTNIKELQETYRWMNREIIKLQEQLNGK